MEKLLELVKEKGLAKSLMSDAKFVEEAKAIFKDKDIELSNEQLADLMGKVEENLHANKKLSETELDNLAAGKKNRGATIAIEVTTGAIGAIGGTFCGLGAGKAGASVAGTAAVNKGASVEVAVGIVKGGMIAGGATGAATGGYVGYKIGDLICKKTGLK